MSLLVLVAQPKCVDSLKDSSKSKVVSRSGGLSLVILCLIHKVVIVLELRVEFVEIQIQIESWSVLMVSIFWGQASCMTFVES